MASSDLVQRPKLLLKIPPANLKQKRFLSLPFTASLVGFMCSIFYLKIIEKTVDISVMTSYYRGSF